MSPPHQECGPTEVRLKPSILTPMSLQVVEVIEPQRRDQRIDELLQKYHKSRKNRVIVFVLYKKEASRVESLLVKRGWKVSIYTCYGEHTHLLR